LHKEAEGNGQHEVDEQQHYPDQRVKHHEAEVRQQIGGAVRKEQVEHHKPQQFDQEVEVPKAVRRQYSRQHHYPYQQHLEV